MKDLTAILKQFDIRGTVSEVKPGALVLWARIVWKKSGNFVDDVAPRSVIAVPTVSPPRARLEFATRPTLECSNT